MRGIIYFISGIREAVWNLRYSLYLWLLSLGFSLFIYIPAKKFLLSRVGHFPDALYLLKHPDYASGFIYSNGQTLWGAIFSMFIIFYIASLIVEAGILSGIVVREDFSAWKRYLWRFVKIELLSPILYIPFLIVGAIPGIFVAVGIPYYKEKSFSQSMLVSAIFFILFFILASVAKDYSKIWVVKENRGSINSMVKAIGISFKFWFSSIIMGIFALALWFIPYLFLAHPFSSLGPFISFTAFQILIFIKAFSKISLYYGENSIIKYSTPA